MNEPIRFAGMLSGAATLALISACGNHGSGQTEAPIAPTASPVPPATYETKPLTEPVSNADIRLQEQLGQLGASKHDTGWSVSLSSAKYKEGQTVFAPFDADRIDRIAQLLRDRTGVHVIVQAYTDSRGDSSVNTKLSRERADSVRNSLMARGVGAGQVRAEGLGDTDPVGTNDTAKGRQENRRVDIVFSDAQGHFATIDQLRPSG